MRKLKTLGFVIGLLATVPCSAQSSRTNARTSQREKSDSSVVMSSGPGSDLQESDVNAPKLEVRIIPDKNVLTAGQILSLRVEFWNIGRKDLFVCKDFQLPNNSACGLTINVAPAGTGPGEGGAVDCWTSAGETFALDMVEEWILLPPNHFYGTSIIVYPESYGGALKSPGRHRVVFEYRSAGMSKSNGPTTCNRVAFYPNELASLPTKAWQGNMQSEPMIIDVIAKPQRQASK